LTSATVTEPGSPTHSFVYVYDPSGNRLSEQVDGATTSASYNALNQITSSSSPGAGRTNEWDALNRLTAVNIGNQRTEFKYNGRGQMVDIRKLVNGSEISHRRFLWCRGRICEERDGTGSIVTKRYFPQGMRMESGPLSGSYYYTRDHLGSIRDVTDGSGSVRGRYSYDPFGRRSLVTGDVQADFGFAGMFWSSEVALAFTHFRAYEPELGRWLSRDPLKDAEAKQGPNLYAYVGNEPIGRIDPAGLAGTSPGLGFNTVSVTILAACSTGSCQELIDDLAPTLEIPAANPQLVQDTAECAEDLAPQASDISLRLQDLAQRAPAVARVATTFLQNTEAVQPWTKLSLVGELPSTFSVMPESVLQWEEDLQDLAWELSEWATAKGENPIDHYAGILRDLITRVNLDPETWKPPE
jgi:RHS repeat-associated protein